jgi:hypothetical protein
LLKSFKGKKWLLPTLVFTVLGIYTYYSARIVLPGILLIYFLIFAKKNWTNFFLLASFGLLVLLCFWPLKFSPLAQKAEQFRLSTQNILTNEAIIKYSAQFIEEDKNTVIAKKIHNRFLYQGKELLDHFSKHLSAHFLLLSGDSNLRHSTTKIGVLLLIAFIGFIYGAYKLFILDKKIFIVLIGSILISLLPASLTYEIPHALRAFNAVIFFNIIAGFGLFQLLYLAKAQNYRYLIVGILSFLFIGQLSLYLHDYYQHYPSRSYFAWQGGYKEAVAAAVGGSSEAKEIIFTNLYARPYIYFLLYSNYNITDFQKERQQHLMAKPLDYLETMKIDKIEFRAPSKEDINKEKVLIIAAPQELEVSQAKKINPSFVLWKNF